MGTKPEPKIGDTCPQCDGAFRQARIPTDEQRAAAANRENPTMLPPNTDTATTGQLEELGVLHTCRDCGYQTRIKLQAEAADAGDEKAAKATRASRAH